MLGPLPTLCLLVDQQYWGFTTGVPLFTYGAGTCLVPVVHEKTTRRGGMAHIGIPTSDWTTGARFCAGRIVAMMNKLRTNFAAGTSWQIFLFGSSFLANHPSSSRGFSRGLADSLRGVEVEDHLAYRPLGGGYAAPAQVLYWPAQGIVAELSDAELTALRRVRQSGPLKGTLIEAYPD